MIEMKIIFNRNKKLKENLSKEELRLLELTSMVAKFNDVIAAHISDLIARKKSSQHIACHCTDSQKNIV